MPSPSCYIALALLTLTYLNLNLGHVNLLDARVGFDSVSTWVTVDLIKNPMRWKG